MEISLEKFEKVKQKAGMFYRALGPVHCPYFAEPVNFNAKGLDHTAG